MVGLGVAGQLMAQLALRGAVVAGFTRSPAKRELAERLGATVTAHPDEAPDLLDELTDAAAPRSWSRRPGTSPRWPRHRAGRDRRRGARLRDDRRGRQGLPYYQMYAKELTLHNPRAALIDDYATAVRLAEAGRINLEPIVTDTLALDDVADAFAVVEQPDSLKVLLRPDDPSPLTIKGGSLVTPEGVVTADLTRRWGDLRDRAGRGWRPGGGRHGLVVLPGWWTPTSISWTRDQPSGRTSPPGRGRRRSVTTGRAHPRPPGALAI